MFRFNAKKAVQAAGVLLDVEGGRMSYFRLLKLLYIADRESIKETGYPITLSHAAALDHGPILSEIYDLIKGSRADEKEWSTYIKTHGHQVTLIQDPGRGKLSRFDICKLREVSERYEPLSEWEIAELTHEFKEYKDNKPDQNSSRPIPIADIINAVGQGEFKDEILNDLRIKAKIDGLVESYPA